MNIWLYTTVHPPCWSHVTYDICCVTFCSQLPHSIVVKLVYSHMGCDFYFLFSSKHLIGQKSMYCNMSH